jgi:hypothetical protein
MNKDTLVDDKYSVKSHTMEKYEDMKRRNELCCCDCAPRIYVWIETSSTSVFVENKTDLRRDIDIKRQLASRANADAKPLLEDRAASSASVNPPGAPDVKANSFGASRSTDNTSSDSSTSFDDQIKKEELVKKDQGKVYRTDSYTVHWEAHGHGELHISLDLDGIIRYSADWLPRSGYVKLSKNYMLEPPNYDPGGQTELNVHAKVTDCMKRTVEQSNGVPRP